MNKHDESIFGKVVFTYTRAEAIADGVLKDVSQTAKEAGFSVPTALTANLWHLISDIPKYCAHEDVEGRLWDVLWMARYGIMKHGRNTDQVNFKVLLNTKWDNRRKRLQNYTAKVHPGDHGETVITIGINENDVA